MNQVDRANDPNGHTYLEKCAIVEEMMEALLAEHGLSARGWTYRMNPIAKRFLGVCNHTDRRIEVSREAIKRNSVTALFNTCTHEVAHALAGYGAGHGPEWQRIHRELGGNGERCGSYESGLPGRYEAVAACGATCGWRWRLSANVRDNAVHSSCGEHCKITWVDHG